MPEDRAASEGGNLEDSWLADQLVESFGSMPGSPERSQIVIMVRQAVMIRLFDDLAEAVGDTILRAPATVAAHLGHLRIGPRPLWVEYSPHAAFRALGGAWGQHVHTVGALLAEDPDQDRHVVGFVAWRTAGGEVYHSYAVLHWDVSPEAPGDGEPPLEFLASRVRIDLPERLKEEMAIWQTPHGGSFDMEEAVDQTRKAALGESTFLLAAALMLATPEADVSEEEGFPDGRLAARLRVRRGLLERLLPARIPGGFSDGGDGMRWRPPVPVATEGTSPPPSGG